MAIEISVLLNGKDDYRVSVESIGGTTPGETLEAAVVCAFIQVAGQLDLLQFTPAQMEIVKEFVKEHFTKIMEDRYEPEEDNADGNS